MGKRIIGEFGGGGGVRARPLFDRAVSVTSPYAIGVGFYSFGKFQTRLYGDHQ